MAVTAGSLIGIYFLIWDNLNLYEYPNGTASVTFQLATAPSGIGTPILPFFLVALTFLVVLEIIQKKRSDLLK